MSSTLKRACARLLSLLVLGFAAATVQAADTWYMVEVIVFAQKHPDAGSEHWPTDKALALPAITAAAALPGTDTAQAKDTRLQTLPADQYRLQAEAKRLTDDGNYTILMHTGWRQPGLAREEAIAVRLQSAPQQVDTTNPTPAPLVLEGTVRLILSRYLHLEADMFYRPDAAVPAKSHSFFASDEPADPMVYHLHETRRMRSKEVHYLDHPMFGIITLVTPYEVAAPAPRQPAPTGRHQ